MTFSIAEFTANKTPDDGHRNCPKHVEFHAKIPEFAGSNSAEAVGFFGHPENPQYAFLRRGSKIICPMSQLCGM
jgi:hypothetical protein